MPLGEPGAGELKRRAGGAKGGWQLVGAARENRAGKNVRPHRRDYASATARQHFHKTRRSII
jgi:hypothetical protein